MAPVPLSQSGDLQQRQKLSFTVEETTCQAPGMATASCKSRWLGVRLHPVGPPAAVPTGDGETEALGRVWGRFAFGAPLGLIFPVSPSASPQAVSWCRGFVFLEQQQPTVELTCEKVPVMVRRCPKRHRPRRVPWLHQPPPPHLPKLGRRCFSSQLGRFRTSRLADFFARIRERFRGFFQCSRIWIRDKLNLKNPKV